MKKKIKFSALTSVVVTFIGLFINLICSIIFKIAPLTHRISGGDIIEHKGFGIDFAKIYSNSPQARNGGVSTSIKFDFISLLVSYIIVFVVVLIIKSIIGRRNK